MAKNVFWGLEQNMQMLVQIWSVETEPAYSIPFAMFSDWEG